MNIDFSNMNKTVEFKEKEIKYGRYLFNKCLPDDYPLIDEQIDTKKLNEILNEIALTYPQEITMKVLDDIKNLGFAVSTYTGYTLSIDDLYDPKLEKFMYALEDNDMTGNLEKLNNNKEMLDIIKSKNYFDFINSGARGSIEQIKQLVVSRGYVSDFENKIKPTLIRSNFMIGLNEEEFFNSCWGTRKGLLDTALSTSGGGYLTRQLIYSTSNIELGTDEDCGTKDYLIMDVVVKGDDGNIDLNKSEKFAKTLLWRYIVTNDNKLHLITTKNYKDIVGKKIRLRSPLYCENKKVCKKCYGKLHNILHSDQIGIIATHALSERITQLILKNFHTSGVVSKKAKDSEDSEDIISGLKIINKLFHSPEDLGVAHPNDLISQLYFIFGQYGNMHLVHYEIIVSSMMWSGESFWRLQKDRDNYQHKWLSILQIPSKSSWLLGVAFSRLRNKLLDGLVKNRNDVPSSLSNLFRF